VLSFVPACRRVAHPALDRGHLLGKGVPLIGHGADALGLPLYLLIDAARPRREALGDLRLCRLWATEHRHQGRLGALCTKLGAPRRDRNDERERRRGAPSEEPQEQARIDGVLSPARWYGPRWASNPRPLARRIR
jgi:hypothetical protein